MHKIFENIDVVVFDIMGVILSNPSLVRKGLYPIYMDRYSFEYVKGLYNDVISNFDGDIDLWKGLKVDNTDKAREEYLETFGVDKGFEEFRSLLTKESIRKGIISNMPMEWGDYFIQKFNLSIDFDPIILSGYIGITKPDYGIYEEFLSRANTRGEKVVFIDDKLENLEMAKRFGMKAVLFDRGKKQDGFKSDLVIKSFSELI